MILRLFADWIYDTKKVRENLNKSKQDLQKSKDFRKHCLESAEKCSELTDTFLMFGDNVRALESLKMWKSNLKFAEDAQKRNNSYIGIILQYESWLSRCS